MPTIVVIAGPSGSGKTVLSNKLKEQHNFAELVSATTRDKREGEIDGVDYNFFTEEKFLELDSQGGLIEKVNYNGKYYGIPKVEAEKAELLGKNSVVVTEPVGVKNVERFCKENDWNIVKVFVNNPVEILVERIENRFKEETKNLDLSNTEHLEIFNKKKSTSDSRLKNMLSFEQKNWVQPMLNGTDKYDISIKEFNSNNTDIIIEQIKNKIDEIANKSNFEVSKKKFKIK